MTLWDLTFTAPNRPASINRTKSMHWAARQRALEPWKDLAWAVARNYRVQARGFVPMPITVQAVLPFRTANRRDPHNYTGTVVKAIVDGLVKAGVVPDDTPDWVTVIDPEFRIVRDKSDPLTATVRIRPRETP